MPYLPFTLLDRLVGIGIGVPKEMAFVMSGLGRDILISLSGGSGCGPSAVVTETVAIEMKATVKVRIANFLIDPASFRFCRLIYYVRGEFGKLTQKEVNDQPKEVLKTLPQSSGVSMWGRRGGSFKSMHSIARQLGLFRR